MAQTVQSRSDPRSAPATVRPPATVQRRTLVDEVYRTLTALVMDHAVGPGARMNIDALARQLEVSPTPVREALARLESDGLVRKEPLRGYTVAPVLTQRELEDLFGFRLLVEPWAARQAAEELTPAYSRLIDAEMDKVAEVPDGVDFQAFNGIAEHDARFHHLLLTIAGNGIVSDAFDRTRCHLHVFRLKYGSTFGSRALAEHRSISAAVRSGDPEGAAQAMTAHLDAAYDRLRSPT